MISPRIELEGFAQLQAAFHAAPELVRRELTGAMYESELLLELAVQGKTPAATPNLRPSIQAQAPQISANGVLGVVGTPVLYAIPVEMGTRPHFPPIQPLEDWVVSKLGLPEKEARGVAFAIALKIARVGTKAVHMFQEGYDENVSRVESIFAAARTRIRNRLASGAQS